jgi:hypothetical protein
VTTVVTEADAAALLLAGAVTVSHAGPDGMRAYVTAGGLTKVEYDARRGWGCSCNERGCPHVLAVQLVTSLTPADPRVPPGGFRA